MANSSMIIMLAIILATMSMLVNTRPLSNTTTRDASTLVERLKLDQGDGDDGGSPGCWEALLELQSCTGEIILFFMNGETYLGPACCRAIEKIEKQCWPNLMGSLGFNSQESDILRGYCDASANDGNVPISTPPPKPFNTTTRPPKPAISTTPPPRQVNITTSGSMNQD
ncbi:egg cell-secreted protein 1.1-like protein [Tanacetum coccineum]